MKTKSIKEQIKEFFLGNPTAKLRVRQIERKIKVPLPSAIRYAQELEQESILKSESIANIKVYSADRASQAFILEKKMLNLRRLYDSGLVKFLVDNYSNPAIMLFGSYSKGEDIENSDIDLYLETSSKQKIDLRKFEEALQRRIQLFIFSNIKKVPNKHLANNILNGIVLNGFVEVF